MAFGMCVLEEMYAEPCDVHIRDTGKSLRMEAHIYRCSRCDGLYRSVGMRHDSRQAYNYCPRCGRKVVRICRSSS